MRERLSGSTSDAPMRKAASTVRLNPTDAASNPPPRATCGRGCAIHFSGVPDNNRDLGALRCQTAFPMFRRLRPRPSAPPASTTWCSMFATSRSRTGSGPRLSGSNRSARCGRGRTVPPRPRCAFTAPSTTVSSPITRSLWSRARTCRCRRIGCWPMVRSRSITSR